MQNNQRDIPYMSDDETHTISNGQSSKALPPRSKNNQSELHDDDEYSEEENKTVFWQSAENDTKLKNALAWIKVYGISQLKNACAKFEVSMYTVAQRVPSERSGKLYTDDEHAIIEKHAFDEKDKFFNAMMELPGRSYSSVKANMQRFISKHQNDQSAPSKTEPMPVVKFTSNHKNDTVSSSSSSLNETPMHSNASENRKRSPTWDERLSDLVSDVDRLCKRYRIDGNVNIVEMDSFRFYNAASVELAGLAIENTNDVNKIATLLDIHNRTTVYNSRSLFVQNQYVLCLNELRRTIHMISDNANSMMDLINPTEIPQQMHDFALMRKNAIEQRK